jgi:hypothetical protein
MSNRASQIVIVELILVPIIGSATYTVIYSYFAYQREVGGQTQR